MFQPAMGWVPSDPKLARDASNMLSEIELDAHRQRASGAEVYEIPYDMIGRLLAVCLPSVSESSEQFLAALNLFVDELPQSMARQVLERIRKAEPFPTAQTVGAIYRLFWEVRWHSLGCPAVNVEPRLAASLMITETPAEMLGNIKPPWDCFVVRLPEALIDFEGIDYTHVVVHRFERDWLATENLSAKLPENVRAIAERVESISKESSGIVWGIYGLSGSKGHFQQEGKLVELLGKQKTESLLDPEFEDDHPAHRLIELFARLVTGVCQMAENQNTLRRKSTKKQSHRWRFSKLPLTTEYVLAPDIPIKFDCTEALQAYLTRDRRSLPKTQWLVRGHWRNQACGPGRSSRARVWIQPYWKGPEDAPRLFREYSIKAGGEGENS